jgi:hypothetical protein
MHARQFHPCAAGQALLENILPQHVANSLVKREAVKRSRVEASSLSPNERSKGSKLLMENTLNQWPDSPRDEFIYTDQANQHQGLGDSAVDAIIAYKQWHPAVSILFAVSLLTMIECDLARENRWHLSCCIVGQWAICVKNAFNHSFAVS